MTVNEGEPRKFEVIKGGDPMLAGFLNAAERQAAYTSGEHQVDMAWVGGILEDPELGEMLERRLQDYVGMGRRAAEYETQVELDTKSIMASITNPGEVELTPELAKRRDGFFRSLDMLNPDAEVKN
ncbi:MAG: hypothetical protein ABIQ89_04245 [Candidatus Saccharimonadales bacterium]